MLITHLALAAEDLNLAGPVPKVKKNGFSGGASQHHSASDPGHRARRLVPRFILGRNVRLKGTHVVDWLMVVKAVAPRVASQCGDPLQLHPSHLFLVFTVAGRVAHFGSMTSFRTPVLKRGLKNRGPFILSGLILCYLKVWSTALLAVYRENNLESNFLAQENKSNSRL